MPASRRRSNRFGDFFVTWACGQPVRDDTFLLLFNAEDEAHDFTMPTGFGEEWAVVLDTAVARPPGDASRTVDAGGAITVVDHSLVVLVRTHDAVPAHAAQAVCETMVTAGIRGILNFAPTALHVPPGIHVDPIDMALSLEKVAYFARQKKASRSEASPDP